MCDNISFGYVLGEECAFLPQNLFPITVEYINNVYIDKNTSLSITIPANLMAELNKKARKKIRHNQQGKKLGMSDIMNYLKTPIKVSFPVKLSCSGSEAVHHRCNNQSTHHTCLWGRLTHIPKRTADKPLPRLRVHGTLSTHPKREI